MGDRRFCAGLLLVFALGGQACQGAQANGVRPASSIHSYPVIRTVESGSLCGLYSLLAAARACGRDLPLDRLFDGRFLVADQSGSSAECLCRAAGEFGLGASIIHAPDFSVLARSGLPALLLLSKSREAEGAGHWVTLLGIEEGRFTVYDSNGGIRQWLKGELQSQWGGLAVVIGGHSPGGKVRIAGLLHSLSWFAPPIGLVGAVTFWEGRRRRNPGKSGDWGRCRREAVAVVGFVLLWAGVVVFADPGHLLRNGQLARMLKCRNPPGEPHFVDWQEIGDSLLVDCRLPTAFAHSHLPDAVNIPVDSGVVELQNRIRHLERGKRIVVYCQNETCGWAAGMAGKLNCLGFQARVLQGGFMGNREAAGDLKQDEQQDVAGKWPESHSTGPNADEERKSGTGTGPGGAGN